MSTAFAQYRNLSPQIIVSLLAALLLNWLPWTGWLLSLHPDFVALVLLYWCAHTPRRVGIGTAWTMGILADVADASLFGQHALAYTLLAFGGTVLHRRIQMLSLRQQVAQVAPLLMSSYAAYALVHWQTSGLFSWGYFLGCAVSILLWMPLSLVMTMLVNWHNR
jgi:rod shape-determining protein MreD